MATIIDPPNSVWPNGLKVDSEGYVTFYPLGTNKVDITTITWPDGDTLISPFVYQNNKLVGFIDTEALTVSGSGATTMNYSHIEANFASISEGKLTVNAPNATIKKFNWAVSTGSEESFDFVIIDFNTADEETINTVRTAKRVVDNKLYDANDDLIGTIDTSKIEVGGFYDREAMMLDGLFCNEYAFMESRDLILSEFNSDLSSLTDGTYMFYCCENLTSFNADLSSMTNAYEMFHNCYNLTSFNANLSSLTDSEQMFYNCNKLESFSSDLSSLTDGYQMLAYCSKLASFNSNLSSLTNGRQMFTGCFNLTSFNANLSSLTDGNWMFENCKLDALSVKNIIDIINTYSGYITLGMGCNYTTEDKDLFAQEVGYADMTSLLAALKAKGWIVSAQYNGRPTTTYGLRRPSEDILPVFVKLEEVEEEEHANYTSEDSSKKFRLGWFHETTGSTDGYTQYATLEEAIESLNIKQIERN